MNDLRVFARSPELLAKRTGPDQLMIDLRRGAMRDMATAVRYTVLAVQRKLKTRSFIPLSSPYAGRG